MTSEETFNFRVSMPKKAQEMLENILLAKKRNDGIDMTRIEWTYEKIIQEHLDIFGTDDPNEVRLTGSE